MNAINMLSAKLVADKLSKVMEGKPANHIEKVSFKLTKSIERDWENVFDAQVRLNLKGSNFGHDVRFRIVASTDNKLMCEIINNGRAKLLPLNTGVAILVDSLREGDKIVSQGLRKQFREFEVVQTNRAISQQLRQAKHRAVAITKCRHRVTHSA